VLYANLIHITRQVFLSSDLDLDRLYEILYALSNILPAISRSDIQNTLPGLQHDFCALWSEIVQKAQIPEADIILVRILSLIHHIYIALHQDTDSAPTEFTASTADNHHILDQASSYPLCNIQGHAVPEEIAHASAATSTTFPHSDAVPSTISLSPGLTCHPLSTLTPHHSRIRLADKPSLDDMPQAATTISPHITRQS
jgi:hypothetical protein